MLINNPCIIYICILQQALYGTHIINRIIWRIAPTYFDYRKYLNMIINVQSFIMTNIIFAIIKNICLDFTPINFSKRTINTGLLRDAYLRLNYAIMMFFLVCSDNL